MAYIRKSDGSRVRVTAEDVWGPPPTKSELLAEREKVASQECERRIYEVAPIHAQMNLSAAGGAGLLTDDQMAAWRAGLLWVGQMRAAWKPLAATDKEITADDSWPECPAAARALADAF